MALRVLLADESTSIKKVLQLALQDFGVEVKAVPIGIDVLPVAKSWTPDIIFCDVLLAKKSGYDVSLEIKSEAQLKKIPVVLMWSGFMEIDEARAQASLADRRLEKPFDAETLRGLVKELVPVTKSNALSDFLTLPRLPDFDDAPPKQPTPSVPLAAKPAPSSLKPQKTNPIVESVHEVDEPEDFTQVPLPKNSNLAKTKPENKGLDASGWSTDNLDRFKIHIPEDNFQEESLGDLSHSNIELTGRGEIQLSEIDNFGESSGSFHEEEQGPPIIHTQAFNSMDPVAMEDMMREQIRTVLSDIAWKIIPDMAERIIREELQKLLKDAEKLT